MIGYQIGRKLELRTTNPSLAKMNQLTKSIEFTPLKEIKADTKSLHHGIMTICGL